MAVRPLHHYRTPGKDMTKSAYYFWETVPVYGNSAYITDDSFFAICCVDRQWFVADHLADPPVLRQVRLSGILDVAFPRRIDAVEALETTLASIDILTS